MITGLPSDPSALTNEDRDTITRNLMPGEMLRWSGHPSRRLHLSRGDAYMIPFSLMWGGFAIIWFVAALSDGPSLFAVWGIPFVLIGLYMIFGRFYYARSRNRRTVYAMTDRRAMSIVRGRSGDEVLAFNLDKLSGVFARPERGGTGIVSFGGPVGWQDASGMGSFNSRRVPAYNLAFFDVPDPQAVAALFNSSTTTA